MKEYYSYMGQTGFNNEKYVEEQSKAIIERAGQFDKLYLEFGGKLMFDYHASRVLPGYHFNAKMQVIKNLAKTKKIEFIFCISAKDLENKKQVSSLGISYRDFTLKMIDSVKSYGFNVSTIVINLFNKQKKAKELGTYLKTKGFAVYYRKIIKNYPTNLTNVRKGYAKKPFIKTMSPIVIVAGAGPGSGKLATCLTMVYQDYLMNKDSGYAKFETFPVKNLPLKSPINGAYEAATADIGDYNLIDPYHKKKYHKNSVNYNRDVEAYTIIKKIIQKIISKNNYMKKYNSPTDMGINEISQGIENQDICEQASKQEIIMRWFKYNNEINDGYGSPQTISRMNSLMTKYNCKFKDRPIIDIARNLSEKIKGYENVKVGSALLLPNGTIITGKNSAPMHAEPHAIINALKELANIKRETEVISINSLKQVKRLRKIIYDEDSEKNNIPEALLLLAVNAKNNDANKCLNQIHKLHSCHMHTTHKLMREDKSMLQQLGILYTSDGKIEIGKLYME